MSYLAEAPEAGPGVGPLEPHAAPRRGSSLRRLARGIAERRSGQVGIVLVVLLFGIALLGPLLAPHPIDEVVGKPFQPPSGSAPLGTDYLGRDVLSRFLSGGFDLLAVSLGATLVAYLVGGLAGLIAGYRGGMIDRATTWSVDVVLSIPPIVVALLLLAGLGSGNPSVAFAIAVILTPAVVRIVRSVTIEATQNEYVEAAVARGESTLAIVVREILPNVRTPLLADFGVRLSWAIVIFSSLSFLGLGKAPPAAAWGLMISENRTGLLVSPWPVIVPAVAIALLAIGVNLVSDAAARSIGRSVVGRDQ